METSDQICKIPGEKPLGMVHIVLSHSYFIYLCAIILGLILNIIFPVYFSSVTCDYEGLIAMTLGSYLIYWAQSTSGSMHKETVEEKDEPNFERGPYRYSRNPTHVGLALATLGFGLIMGSYFIVILSAVAYAVTKLIFLPKEEKILAEEYGSIYCQYQAKVRTWL